MTAIVQLRREPDRQRSAAETAYLALRADIVEGRLAPGHRLREVELAARVGASRTPVREALSRLQADGLIEFVPRLGLAVAALDDAAVMELYETREALEGTAAGLAARHANGRDVATLRALLEADAAAGDDALAVQRLNRAFHEAVFQAAHNRFLLKSFVALHDALALLGPTTLVEPGRREEARAEHARITDAIARHDPAVAEAEMRRHVQRGGALRQARRAAARDD